MPNPSIPRPVLLAILDGFGESAHPDHNAVTAARTPTLGALRARFPHGLLNASELQVGLPEGQMGNSEVGHMNIGSGRVLMQELPRIDQAIDTGELGENQALLQYIAKLKASRGACHLLGLLSPGGVHSHQRHMAELAKRISAEGVPVKIHAFLDGRDTPPKSALACVAQFKKDFSALDFMTVSGRYYAMDRDQRWERVELAYSAIANADGPRFPDIAAAIESAYAQGVTDEFLPPAVIGDYAGMRDNDGLLMVNFRADRAREILQALLYPDFKGFARPRPVKFKMALGMVEYSTELNRFMKAMFSPESLNNILGEVLAKKGLRQLRIAETEKYAHVTFFFNGGREEPFAGEERILIPSPKVATYDLKPEMSAPEVTDRLVAAIDAGTFDFIVVNYANCDMVGHTGSLAAATKAVEAVDTALGRVWQAIEKKGGAMIVTADHGNAEQMFDDATHQPHTAHTLNLVPVILAVPALAGGKLSVGEGKLADLAPTVLKLMGLPQPIEMTGKALI
jgi:2,3-bisphosphoglycerate-independent phosphoglycerate mutase